MTLLNDGTFKNLKELKNNLNVIQMISYDIYTETMYCYGYSQNQEIYMKTITEIDLDELLSIEKSIDREILNMKQANDFNLI